jgi:kinesin family protein 13
MNIKVAIRVRPFNQRELDLKSELCVDMTPTQTHILKQGGGIERTFTYDHCFWSHDSYKSDSKGYHLPADKTSKYCDQEKVYNTLGKEILTNAINGYHCCLFAYGQTGAGKSYSIFGYDENKGIVPKICTQLVDGSTLIQNDKHTFSLTISMLEIYNEKIQDLLIPVAKRPKGGLKIRENAKLGVFVEDLTKSEVISYAEIEAVIEMGNKNKTLGSTLMNATSSRAHTIITLELIQKEVGLVKTTQKESVINLVDLAGSEKVGKTEAKGDRLKEACSINKSLTVLGIVIHQLYKKSTGEKITISYRDSALTRILQNALGGNSKTTMICAISPARDNIEETLSTLRYADQAKKIKLNAKVNESETDKLIRELMEENEKLKAMLADLKTNKDKMAVDDISNQIRELESVIQYRTTIFNPSQIKIDHKNTSLNNNQKNKDKSEALQKNPHIYNLNEDPLLNKKIIYDFKETPFLSIGRQSDNDLAIEMNSDTEKKVILNGVGIIEDHARLIFIDNKLTIIAADYDAACNTFINGESLENYEKDGSGFIRYLSDLDRVIFGTSSTFLVRLPNKFGNISDEKKTNGREIDWEFCQMEKFKKQEKEERDRIQEVYEEKEMALKDMEAQLKQTFDKEKKDFELKMESQRMEYERAIAAMQKSLEEKEAEKQESQLWLEQETLEAFKQMQNEQKAKELEYQIRVNALHTETQLVKQIQIINTNLEKRLINYYHKIKEANYIAQELNRNVEFVPFVASLNLLSTLNQKAVTPDLIVNVKLINYEEGWVNYWGLEKFDNRLILFRDALEYFFSHNKISYDEQNDPFWDPEEFFLYGQAFCLAKSVLYKFEITHKVGILGYEGDIGYAIVQLMPLDDDGSEIDDENSDIVIKNPDDLIRRNLSCHFRVHIQRLVLYNISNIKGKNGYLNFEVQTSADTEDFSTPPFKIHEAETLVNFWQVVKIPTVTPDLIDFYLHKNIQFRLFVDKIDQVPCKGKNPPPVIFKEKMYVDLNKELQGRESFDPSLLKKVNFRKTNLKRATNLRQTNLFQEKSSSANICSVM